MDIEIDGLIIDQTKSKLGRDFASNFTLSWETAATGYNIVIDEQADFRAGSWVSLEVNGSLAGKHQGAEKSAPFFYFYLFATIST